MHLDTDQSVDRAIRGVVVDRHAHQPPVDRVHQHVPARGQVNRIPFGGDQSGQFLIVSEARQEDRRVPAGYARYLPAKGKE